MEIRSKLAATGAAALAWMVVAFVTACNEGRQSRLMEATDWGPFVEMARQSDCADARNRLFVIDHTLVFWDRAGNCPDNAYSRTLYGKTVRSVLCDLHDSIAGPIRRCPVSGFQGVFNVIIGHLDEPDLGLGPGHTVQPLPF